MESQPQRIVITALASELEASAQATAAANAAAESANEAAESANEAADNANEAAESANAAVLGVQKWKPAVQTYADLPVISGADTSMYWLCRVRATNDTYQWIPDGQGAGQWNPENSPYSSGTDYIDPTEVDNVTIEWDNVNKYLKLKSGAAIGEAPQDGKTYGRKNGQWVEITGGSGGGIAASIDVLPEELIFENTANDTKTAQAVATKAWNIDSAPTWLNVPGIGDAKLPFTSVNIGATTNSPNDVMWASPNLPYKTGDIVLKAIDNSVTKNLVVKQKPLPCQRFIDLDIQVQLEGNRALWLTGPQRIFLTAASGTSSNYYTRIDNSAVSGYNNRMRFVGRIEFADREWGNIVFNPSDSYNQNKNTYVQTSFWQFLNENTYVFEGSINVNGNELPITQTLPTTSSLPYIVVYFAVLPPTTDSYTIRTTTPIILNINTA